MGFSRYGHQDPPGGSAASPNPAGHHIIRRLDYAVNERVTRSQKALPFATSCDTIFCERKAVGSDERGVFDAEPAHIVAIRIIGEKATA